MQDLTGSGLESARVTSTKFYWPTQVLEDSGGGEMDSPRGGKSLEVTLQRRVYTVLQTIKPTPPLGSEGGCHTT